MYFYVELLLVNSWENLIFLYKVIFRCFLKRLNVRYVTQFFFLSLVTLNFFLEYVPQSITRDRSTFCLIFLFYIENNSVIMPGNLSIHDRLANNFIIFWSKRTFIWDICYYWLFNCNCTCNFMIIWSNRWCYRRRETCSSIINRYTKNTSSHQNTQVNERVYTLSVDMIYFHLLENQI